MNREWLAKKAARWGFRLAKVTSQKDHRDMLFLRPLLRTCGDSENLIREILEQSKAKTDELVQLFVQVNNWILRLFEKITLFETN